MLDDATAFDLRPFGKLSAAELYACLRLRSEIFVVEQDCAYQDLDGLDQRCLHLRLLGDGGQLLGYARLVPPGLDFADACAIGRVVVAGGARGRGHGRALVLEGLAHCARLYGAYPVKLHAQTYLRAFYCSLGFSVTGAEYLEDGLPHVEMTRA